MKNLLLLCPEEVRKEINECIDSDDGIDYDQLLREAIENYQDDCDGFGLHALFIKAVREQEHIGLIDATTENDEAIIFEPWYPWQEATEQEKNMTEEKLRQLFKKYQVIMDIPEEQQVPMEYIDIVSYC